MIDDTQIEYLVKFFDGGSLKKLKTQLANAEKAVARFEQRAKDANGEVVKLMNLQALADKQGFSSNVKLDRAGNSLIAGGGAEAERKAAINRGIIAKRNVQEAERILKLSKDARLRLASHHTELEKQQAIALTTLTRQEFANREVLTLKQAQVKLEAAKLRAGEAARQFAGNTDGRSSNRLSTNLANSQLDVAAAEKQVAAMKQVESASKRVAAQQVKINSALDRANILRKDGNIVGAKREIQNARIAKSKQFQINQERLTNAQLKEQVRLNESIARAKARAASSVDPLASLNNRLKDGGAGLLKIQAQLLANYAAMGLAFRALSFAGKFVVDLDREFAQLQAITATTDESMGKLEKTIVEVSEGVKFTALEVAEAATIMGQAGFSVEQITGSIQNITLLATAVGTDLKTAVDLVTSTISVFNLRAEEAGNIANVFTTAVNNSKLNLEKLTLGLQYAGNIANEQNITFSELTATLGAMANSGIRSGSTLGTGLRQILTALAAPSEKLNSRLTELGLSTDDVNVKLYGLTGVLKNLQDAGFTTSDALQVLEVRAGAAYAALTNNASTIEELRQKFLLSSAAAEANAVQMEALANKGLQLQSIFGTFAAKALGPLVDALKFGADILGLFLRGLNNLGPVVPIVTTALVAYTAAVIANRAALLARNLVGKASIAGLLGEAAATRAAGLGYKGLLVAMGPVGGGIAAITAVIGLAKIGIDFFSESVDELKASVDESSGKLETYTANIRSIDKEIEILTQRHFEAGESMQEVNNIALELQLKFGDLGGSFDFTNGKIQDLVPELERLRDVMLDVRNVELNTSIDESTRLLEGQSKQARKKLAGVLPKDAYGGFRRSSTLSPFGFDSDIVGQARQFDNGKLNDTGILELYRAVTKIQADNNRLTLAMQNGVLSPKDEALLNERIEEGRNSNFGFRFQDNTTREEDIADAQAVINAQNRYLQEFTSKFLPVVQTTQSIAGQKREVTQNTFNSSDEASASRSILISLDQQLAKAKSDRSNFTNKDLPLPEGSQTVEQVVEAIRKAVDADTAKFKATGQEREFAASGLSQTGAALLSRAEAAVKMTDQQLREFDAGFKLQQANRQREIDLIRRSLDVKDSENVIAQGRAAILERLAEKQEAALAQETARLDREGKHGKEREIAEATFATSLRLEREKVIAALDKLSLEKEIRTRKISYESLEIQLEKEIALERKRVTKRSSLNEIEAAKQRALQLQSDKELAAREDLRFRLAGDTELLDLEMTKLNATLKAEREEVALSFDGMHTEIREKQVPQIRNALKELTDSFDVATKAFDDKIEALQNPVADLQAARDATDAASNKGKFSQVHKDNLDREIQNAQVKAMRTELDLLKTENLARLTADQAALEASKADIDAKLRRAEEILANTGGNYSPDEMKQASREINQLKAQGLEIDGEITAKADEIIESQKRIRDLQREIGAVTGEAAPDMYNWTEALNEGLQAYIDKLEEASLSSDNFADKVVEVGDVATDSLGDAFFDIATGAKSVGEAFGDMAESILKAILKILAEQVAIFAIKQLFAAFGFSPQTFSGGGAIKGFSGGGRIPNLGVTGRDHVPIMAEAGEFMMRKSAVDSIGKDKLYAMNALGSAALKPDTVQSMVLPDGKSQEVNVYVMAPEEKPQLGPDDILHVIGQDIATGGQTKKLIKHAMN